MPATTGMKGAGYYEQHSVPAGSRDCSPRRSCLGLGQTTSSFARRGVAEMETETTLASAWEQHIASEFAAKSAEQALATMTAEPYVNEVPLMIGARGRKELHDFYANHFLSQIPPDMEMVPVSRTIGQGRVVDELIMRFTHTIRMDWPLPGIPPTGKRVELPFVVIVQFEGDKLARAPLLGPGVGAGAGRFARSHTSGSWRRDCGATAQPQATDERTHPSRDEQQ